MNVTFAEGISGKQVLEIITEESTLARNLIRAIFAGNCFGNVIRELYIEEFTRGRSRILVKYAPRNLAVILVFGSISLSIEKRGVFYVPSEIARRLSSV